jgi:hypothetical protein
MVHKNIMLIFVERVGLGKLKVLKKNVLMGIFEPTCIDRRLELVYLFYT